MVYGTEQDGLKGYTDADGASQEHRHAISQHQVHHMAILNLNWHFGTEDNQLVVFSPIIAE